MGCHPSKASELPKAPKSSSLKMNIPPAGITAKPIGEDSAAGANVRMEGVKSQSRAEVSKAPLNLAGPRVSLIGVEWLELELQDPEWLVPALSAEEETVMEEYRGVRGELGEKDMYSWGLKGMWKNWIDLLELALSDIKNDSIEDPRRKLDVEYMRHKLEFTRIRQEMVQEARTYLGARDLPQFQSQSKMLLLRCEALAATQPEEMESALPSLVPKRDTMMLHSRIKEMMKKVEMSHRASERQNETTL